MRMLPDDFSRDHFHRWAEYFLFAAQRQQPRVVILQGRGGKGKGITKSVIRHLAVN